MNNTNVTISVFALYAKFGNQLSYCTIEVTDDDKGNFWYDIYDWNELVCMDGEEVSVYEIAEHGIMFRNDNGDTATYFRLTYEECEVALLEEDYKRITNVA